MNYELIMKYSIYQLHIHKENLFPNTMALLGPMWGNTPLTEHQLNTHQIFQNIPFRSKKEKRG